MLAVTDSGAGIPADVLPQVFEPFFTTKPVGAGSGLGLSMVYGFARQSGGNVRVYSEPGHGTTVRLYLPRARGAVEPAAAPAGDDEPVAGEETILGVEDDVPVRKAGRAPDLTPGYPAEVAAWRLSSRSGSTARLPLRISKCSCGRSTLPLRPTRAMVWPRRTISPRRTSRASACA